MVVIAITLGIGLGVLGAAQASKQNRFLRQQGRFVGESAQAHFKALAKQRTQIRSQALDTGLRISTEAQVEAGRAEAAFGGVSGVSVSTVLASVASDVASDTAVIQRNRDAALDAVDSQKDDVFREASNEIRRIGSQMKNPVIVGIMAGIGGVQAGLSLGSAFKSVSQLNKMNEASVRLGTATSQTGAISLTNSVLRRNSQDWFTAHSRHRLGEFNSRVTQFQQSNKFFGPVP